MKKQSFFTPIVNSGKSKFFIQSQSIRIGSITPVSNLKLSPSMYCDVDQFPFDTTINNNAANKNTSLVPKNKLESMNNCSSALLQRRNQAQIDIWQNRQPRQFKSIKQTNSIQQCLQLGLQRMWQFDLENALNYFSKFRMKDVRHALHYTQAEILKVLLVGKNGQLSHALNQVKRMQKQLQQAKAQIKRGVDVCGGAFPIKRNEKNQESGNATQRVSRKERFELSFQEQKSDDCINDDDDDDDLKQIELQNRSFFDFQYREKSNIQLSTNDHFAEIKEDNTATYNQQLRNDNFVASSPQILLQQLKKQTQNKIQTSKFDTQDCYITLISQRQYIDLLDAENRLLKAIILAFRQKKVDMFFTIKGAWDLYKSAEVTFISRYNSKVRGLSNSIIQRPKTIKELPFNQQCSILS